MERVLLIVLLFGWTCCPVTSFDAVQWSTEITSSQKCGADGNSEPTDALQTVAELIKNTTTTSSLPNSCLEIKENSAVSPSGYYTISNGSDGSAVVVYCNMDDLSSCPALEQTLSGIKKDVGSLFENMDSLFENVDSLSEGVDSLSEDMDSLSEDVGSLSEDMNSLSEDMDSVFENVDSLFTSIDSPLASSCSELKERCPQCKNGVYEIAPDPSSVKFVYCAFENSTYCNVTGPWVKLASWNLSEPGSSCPSELQLFVNGTVSACGRQQESSAGCQSLPLFSSPVPYTHVCGRMIGYQKGSNDAFWGPQGPSIDGPYVDGVSITRGSPREHVWTYAIGVQENFFIPYDYQCPCVDGSTKAIPSYVGNDYFCESGCPGYWDGTTFHAADPLWDGKGCGALESACCAAPGLPWFHKVLNVPTTDYIEMRLCIEEPANGENVLISFYEIYIL